LASIDKGKKGYIIFPWAAGGNLQEFWAASEQETSRKRVLWSLQQILGLTTALHVLHEQFGCRHGDLKPGNILCVQEGGETVLKIADFGVSRIHHAKTMYRKKKTTSVHLTPSYQGPEVEFEAADMEDQRPRSRKYDVWSLGCVFLEFTIWLLHGPKAIEGFAGARGKGTASTDHSPPLYEVTDKEAKAARVHQLVSWTIERLEDNPQCKGESALAALLSLIKNQMLQPKVEDRPLAGDICKELENIIQEAKKHDSYLLHSCDSIHIPPLDFEKF
jgi:serine/threonine protein kinase